LFSAWTNPRPWWPDYCGWIVSGAGGHSVGDTAPLNAGPRSGRITREAQRRSRSRAAAITSVYVWIHNGSRLDQRWQRLSARRQSHPDTFIGFPRMLAHIVLVSSEAVRFSPLLLTLTVTTPHKFTGHPKPKVNVGGPPPSTWPRTEAVLSATNGGSQRLPPSQCHCDIFSFSECFNARTPGRNSVVITMGGPSRVPMRNDRQPGFARAV